MIKINLNRDSCWEWPRYKAKNGYGIRSDNEGPKLVHRLSYEHHIGTIPRGMHVCHTCDFRACFNPDHLFLGTQADNLADMAKKKRQCNKIPHDQIPVIRKRLSAGDTQTSIARDYGVSQAAIFWIKSGKNWKHT